MSLKLELGWVTVKLGLGELGLELGLGVVKGRFGIRDGKSWG